MAVAETEAPALDGGPRWHPRFGMAALIAWRNLVHDRIRLAVTLVGIAFSVLLMGLQGGILVNFIDTVTIIVARSGADIWITAPGVNTVDIPTQTDRARRFQSFSAAGVVAAENITYRHTFWRRPDGLNLNVLVIGLEPDTRFTLPPGLEGDLSFQRLMETPDAVIIDRRYMERLGINAIGDMAEVNNRRVRVVGVTEGIRTFTQNPYVFTTLANAQRMAGDDRGTYVLVSTAAGEDVQAVAARLRQQVTDVDVHTRQEFAAKSANYWLFRTGAGVSLIMTSFLGLLVGTVIVAQTLYSSTMERLPEYGTIRAIGGPRSYLYKIVLLQAALGGLLGWMIGIAAVTGVVFLLRNANVPPQLPPWMPFVLLAITTAMCTAASMVSLRQVMGIDPLKVFR